MQKTDGTPIESYATAFQNDYQFFPNLFFDIGQRRLIDVRMNEVRGRVLLISDAQGKNLPTASWTSIWG
jgi:hypothetical protein